MFPEDQDANTELDSSSVQDANASEPSTEETQTAEPTAQQGSEPKEVPFHEHPRWQEMLEHNNQLKSEIAELKQQGSVSNQAVLDILNRVTAPKGDDPLANVDGETKNWVNSFLKPIIHNEVSKAKEDASKPLLQKLSAYEKEVQGYQKMVGRVLADSFISSHPDVKRGSPEMKAIVTEAQTYTNLGMDTTESLERAYKTVMFDKNAQLAVEKSRRQQVEKNKQKQEANQETGKTIPQNQLPPSNTRQGDITEDDMVSAAKELGVDLPPI